MHTARQLDVSHFSLTRSGEPATREHLFPGWTPLDRFGIVVREPFGAVGASLLIQLAITAFYDIRPDRRAGRLDGEDPRAIYPDIFLFHVGGAYGDHSAFDFWPARKEVFVVGDPRLVLDAINDRGITRLAVPDMEPRPVQHEHKEPAAARDRISTVLAYSPTGRVENGDWEITGLNRRTEKNVVSVLSPHNRYVGRRATGQPPSDPLLAERDWAARVAARRAEGAVGLELARNRREHVRNEDGVARETYRTRTVDEALSLLA